MKCILIFSWLISHAYSPHITTGITNNLYIESKCNPNAKTSHQFGLAQWQGTRLRDLITFANHQHTLPNNLTTQLLFLDYEFKKIFPPVRARNAMGQERPDANNFSYIFCQKFERPKSSCHSRIKIQTWN